MGGGITMTLINAGLQVVLLESGPRTHSTGGSPHPTKLSGRVAQGISMRRVWRAPRPDTPTLQYEPLRDVDLVIEAVFEDMDVKRQVFEKLDDS